MLCTQNNPSAPCGGTSLYTREAFGLLAPGPLV